MSTLVIRTEGAPRAIGPYSQAIRAGDFLYTSGQISLDPTTGELLQGTIEEETRQVMVNLAAVLEAAGASFSQVIKTTIFLTDLTHFAAVNSV
ncbi:MAG: Rid family detoxifying hydrolase, partial [Myxococcales bacterium]|nr:Rid family detoxifying hydrolase [Myxococcales bacterium]